MLQRRSFGCDLTPERGHPTARHERRRREGPATLYSRLRTGAARPSVLEHALAGRMPALPAHGRVRMNAAIMKRGRGNSLRQEKRPPPSGGLAGRRPFLSGEAPHPRMTPMAPAINGESAKAAGAPVRSVNHDPDAQPQVVLTRAGDEERLPHRLERRRRQDDAGLLVAAVDDVPVDLPGAHVEAVVEFDVDAAAEGHRE